MKKLRRQRKEIKITSDRGYWSEIRVETIPHMIRRVLKTKKK